MSAKIHKLDTHAGNNKYKNLVTSTKEILQLNLTKALNATFDAADDILFKAAENANDSSLQNTMFDNMRLLRIERPNISRAFIRNVCNRITKTKTVKDDPFNADELSLVSQDEMEELVAISSITNRADSTHAEAISHLQARIEHLKLKSNIIFNKDALLPINICSDFVEQFSALQLADNTRLIFIKVFGQQIDNALKEIYDTINYRFIEADILPQIKPSRPAARPSAPEANNSLYSLAPTGMEQISFPSVQGLPSGQEIQQILQSYIQQNIPAAAITRINEQNYYDRSQVINTLSKLQLSFSQTAQNNLNFDQLRQALLTNINSGKGGLISKQVNHVDEKTIEIIEMLFKQILNDHTLTSAMRNLILRMQIPVVKVAMLDQYFFQNPEHPARSFLNTLAFIGIGITDDEDEMLPRLETIIDTMLNEYEQDSVSFQRALDSLNTLINKELDHCHKKEQDTQKKVLREHARKIVLVELQKTIKGKQLPKQLEPVVLKLWPTQMYQQYLNYGKDSAQWLESVQTLQKLMNSIQPPATQKELQQLIHHQDEILQLIQNKLYASQQDKEQINQAIYNLSEIYLELINSADIHDPEELNFEDFALQTISGDTSALADIHHKHSAANIENLFLHDEQLQPAQPVADKREQLQLLPREVKPGLWFELYDGDDKSVRRLKLSVIIMEEAQLIFVNRQGVRIMEKNAKDFAAELESGKSSIIADHSVFDQALTNVISALQKTS